MTFLHHLQTETQATVCWWPVGREGEAGIMVTRGDGPRGGGHTAHPVGGASELCLCSLRGFVNWCHPPDPMKRKPQWSEAEHTSRRRPGHGRPHAGDAVVQESTGHTQRPCPLRLRGQVWALRPGRPGRLDSRFLQSEGLSGDNGQLGCLFCSGLLGLGTLT